MPVDLVRSLSQQLDTEASTVGAFDAYYSGRQPLAFLHPQVRAATAGRLQNVAVNWCRVVVGAVEERLDVEGFRVAGEDAAIPDLWRVWQRNNLDEASALAHVDALVHGRSFALVWPEGDRARVTVETAREVTVTYEPGTDVLASALKRFGTIGSREATLFLPGSVERWVEDAGGWRLVEQGDNPLGVVPLVPLVNNRRSGLTAGESELSDVVPLVDAINKLCTDLMVSAEYHAMPRRSVTGIQLAPAGTPEGERDRELFRQFWTQAEAGRVWAGPAGAQFSQFPEATLTNFIDAVRMFTEQIAALAKLPPHMLGVNTANPASADAIRSAESGLVQKVRRKMRGFGGAWEQVMRLAAQVEGITVADPDLLETIWRDPETPTVAQQADAVVKLLQGDRPVITVRQGREDLGYSPVQIAAMEREDAAAALGPVRAQLDEAARLQREDGLSQRAAYAAVGLLQAAQAIGPQTGV